MFGSLVYTVWHHQVQHFLLLLLLFFFFFFHYWSDTDCLSLCLSMSLICLSCHSISFHSLSSCFNDCSFPPKACFHCVDIYSRDWTARWRCCPIYGFNAVAVVVVYNLDENIKCKSLSLSHIGNVRFKFENEWNVPPFFVCARHSRPPKCQYQTRCYRPAPASSPSVLAVVPVSKVRVRVFIQVQAICFNNPHPLCRKWRKHQQLLYKQGPLKVELHVLSDCF